MRSGGSERKDGIEFIQKNRETMVGKLCERFTFTDKEASIPPPVEVFFVRLRGVLTKM